MNDLIPINNASQIVAACEDTYRDIYAAFELLEKAKIRLKNTFGEHRDSILPSRFSDYQLGNDWRDDAFVECKNTIKNHAWNFIVDKTQIKTLLSIKRQEELDKQMNREASDKLPEVTEEAIFEFINHTLGNAPNLVEEALQEIFEILRPHKQYHCFKTNSEFEIGSKVFFEWWMDTSYGFLHFRREKELTAIDKLFHLLDGRPTPQYPNGAVSLVNNACRLKQWQCETDYLKLSWFKKGSFHIEFKRLDLVAEINKRAGGMRLKGGQ